ncbi:MAG: TetR family transcriptional regulator [Conexibacter sp.]|nr:TetR family transcriptional regulator [Conexibacter sp.]
MTDPTDTAASRRMVAGHAALEINGPIVPWSKRDAEATRRRILDAAIDEFAAHGIAGARIDRIAAASASNKSLIYTYYGSKVGLFDAVDDLRAYAARLFDQHLRRPEPLRIGEWDRLERGGTGMAADSVVKVSRDKVQAIAAGQRDGRVSGRFPAATLLELILSISRAGVTSGLALKGRPAAARRRAIADAVALLAEPERDG